MSPWIKILFKLIFPLILVLSLSLSLSSFFPSFLPLFLSSPLFSSSLTLTPPLFVSLSCSLSLSQSLCWRYFLTDQHASTYIAISAVFFNWKDKEDLIQHMHQKQTVLLNSHIFCLESCKLYFTMLHEYSWKQFHWDLEFLIYKITVNFSNFQNIHDWNKFYILFRGLEDDCISVSLSVI